MMPTIIDDYMRLMLAGTGGYCVVIPKADRSGMGTWSAKFRASRPEGVLAIVCPVNDGTDVCGMGSSPRALKKPEN